MKITCLILAVAICAGHAEDIKLLTGQIIKGDVSRVDPDGVSVITNDGIQKFTFLEMAPEMRTKFGFDEAKAEAFRQQQRAADQARGAQAAAALAQQIARDAQPNMSAIRLTIEQSGFPASVEILQCTEGGSRVSITTTTVAGPHGKMTYPGPIFEAPEGFVYGMDGAEKDFKMVRLFPCGLYRYTTVSGAPRTVHAYATNVEEVVKRGADKPELLNPMPAKSAPMHSDPMHPGRPSALQ